MATWPFDIRDPIRAVHYALEPHCVHADPALCPREIEVRRTIEAFTEWAEVQRAETEL